MGARFVATGHYARLTHGADGPHLFAADPAKDQSYTLAQATREQLESLLLPLGALTKAETRAHAARLGLALHAKPESQDICFVEGGDYRTVLERDGAAADSEGAVMTTTGERVGAHRGLSHFTVGQRRELPATTFNDGPRYVTRIDAATNTIVIGREHELYAAALVACEVNLIRPERFAEGALETLAMTRYRSPLNRASAAYDRESNRLHLTFAAPERAVAPGQLVALYDEHGEVLAGATIESAA